MEEDYDEVIEQALFLEETIEFLGDQLPENKFEVKSFVVYEALCSDTINENYGLGETDEERFFPLMYLRSMITILEDNLIS